MIKKILVALSSVCIVLAGVAYVIYASNSAPAVAAISASEASNPTKPYVVKVHAQWCSICMETKAVWRQIEEAYAQRVSLVVFDMTNQTTTDASRAEARRLGLDAFFDENAGSSGTIAIVDARSKTTTASIRGSQDFAEYRTAIDRALKATKE